MKFKKLVWKNNVTKLGKEKGVISFTSYVKELKFLYYSIQNQKGFYGEIEKCFYVFLGNENDTTSYKTLKEAKQAAQKHFEQTILSFFFIE